MCRKSHFIASGIIVLSGFLMVSSVWLDSPTLDEALHLRSGYAAVSQSDLGLNTFHPPLWKMIAAFPLLLRGETPDFDNPGTFLLPRIMLITVSLAFLWVYFLWAEKRSGGTTALFALIMLSFNSPFLSQARYISTDTGAMWGYWAGTAALVNFLEKKSIYSFLLLLAALSFALLTKFSMLLLVPLVPLIAVFWALAGRGRWRLAGYVFFGVLLALCLVMVTYFTGGRNTPESRVYDHLGLAREIKRTVFVDLYRSTLNIPSLRKQGLWLMGVMGQFNQSMVENRKQGWLAGMSYQGGSPAYFPILWSTKEPLGFCILSLVALLLGCVRFFRSPKLSTQHALGTAAIFIAMTAYWALSLNSTLNIGIRHILPVFTLQCFLAAQEISVWIGKSLRWLIVAALMLLSGILSVVSQWPGYLSYFNALAGGSAGGLYWAGDSNYDWGQDNRRLEIFMDKNRISEMHARLFLDIPPFLRGRLKWFDPDKAAFKPGDYVAISANSIRRFLCPLNTPSAKAARSLLKLFTPYAVLENPSVKTPPPPEFPILNATESPDGTLALKGGCDTVISGHSTQLDQVQRVGDSIFVYRYIPPSPH